MTPIRSTTSPPLPLEPRERPRPSSRLVVQPVFLEREVEADRRRSLREELDADDEHAPTETMESPAAVPPETAETAETAAEHAAAAHELAGELERLGSDALRLLQPIDPRVQRLADDTHVDEQA